MSAKTVRLCIVMGSHWETRMGGAQFQMKCLVEQLEQHPEFEVFYLARLTPEKLTRAHYTIVQFGSGKKIGRSTFLPDLLPLYSTLKKARPDVVYQRGLKSYTAACARYCRQHNVRFVFHAAHDEDVQRPSFAGWGPLAILNRIERRISEFGLRRANDIVVQTNDQLSMLRAAYGLEATLVVRNFHPMPASPPPRLDKEILRVTWVANFKPWKNPEIFVNLAEAFRDRTDIEFVMIGRAGPRYDALRSRMSRIPNLKYLGELSLDQVNDALALSDLFVNTSTAEGFANTFIQAWLRNVPVISCFVDPDRCLSEGGGGILAKTEVRLREIVTDLLHDRSRLSQLKASALNYGIRHHTVEQAEALLLLLSGRTASFDNRVLPSCSPGADQVVVRRTK